MEVSGQLHVPAALTPGKNRVKEAGCASELHRTFRRTQKYLSPVGTRTPEQPGRNVVTALTIKTRCYADLLSKQHTGVPISLHAVNLECVTLVPESQPT
jgi:hypothetical protein